MRLISASTCLRTAIQMSNKARKLLAAACTLAMPLALPAQVVSFAGLQTTLSGVAPLTGITAPVDVAIDATGNRFIINSQSANIIEVSAAGVETTIPVFGLANPQAIAVDSTGNLYVADSSRTDLVKVAAGTSAVSTVGSGLSSPSGVAVDSAGNVYIADGGNHHVVRIAASNGAQTVVSGPFSQPVSVAVNAAQSLYVSDIGTHSVYKVTFAGSIPTVTTAISGLNVTPYSVSADAAGDILLSGDSATGTSDHLLTLYGINGVIRQLGTGLGNPRGTAVDASGNVYVADEATPAVAIIAPGSVDFGQAHLCPASGSQLTPCTQSVTLNFNVASGAILNGVTAHVLTQGDETLDFTSTNNTCTGTENGPYTCSITAKFTPLAPGVRLGAVDLRGTVASSSNAPFVTTVALHGVGLGSLAGFDAGVISSPVTLGNQSYVASVIADSSGNLYFVEGQSPTGSADGVCLVQKYVTSTGLTSVVAGNGTCGPAAGDGGPATSAVFTDPWRLALNGRGDLFIADDKAAAVRKVDAVTGIITTVAGTLNTSDFNPVADYFPDGTVATSAKIGKPFALALDGSGNLYFSDTADQTVRKVDAQSGVLTTVAGNYSLGGGYSGDQGLATSAQLDLPLGLALDSNGNLFIADNSENVIREVTASTGIITTVAGAPQTSGGYGGDGAAATSAQLNDPEGLAVDAGGNLYIADSGNYVVRKVSAATGLISTVAGVYTGSIQNTAPGAAANLAGLGYIQDATVDSNANFYLVDRSNNAIREVTQASGIVNFATYNMGASSSAIDVALTNDGNAALNLSGLTTGTNFNFSGTDTSCTASTVLSVGASCVLGVEFLPTTTGLLTGSVTVTDDADGNAVATQLLVLSGTGAFVPTQVVLSAVPATIPSGSSLGSIQASIESSGGNLVTNSTASVTATITGPGGYSQAVTAAAAGGIATLNLGGLPLSAPGTYTLTATSSGLTSSTASTTVVAAATKLAISGLPATLAAGGNLGIAAVSIESASGSIVTSSVAAVALTIAGPGSYTHVVNAVAAGGMATIDLSSFALTTPGTYTVTGTSTGLSSATVTVAVAAPDFILAVSTATGSSATQTVTAGAAATYALTVTPANSSYAQAITLTATGLPPGASYTFSPATVTPGAAAATTTLTIQTSATTVALRRLQRLDRNLGSIAFGLMILPISLLSASRRLRQAATRIPATVVLLGILSLGAVCGLTGCGGSSGTSKTSPPTPQSYTVTVIGTSGAVNHSTTVTLIVQ